MTQPPQEGGYRPPPDIDAEGCRCADCDAYGCDGCRWCEWLTTPEAIHQRLEMERLDGIR